MTRRSWSCEAVIAAIQARQAEGLPLSSDRVHHEAIIKRIRDHAEAGHGLSAHRMTALDAAVVASAPRYFPGGWEEALRGPALDTGIREPRPSIVRRGD